MDMLDLFFTARTGLTLTEISSRLNLPKSTAHGVLQSMRVCGYVTYDDATRCYAIGLRVVALAHASPASQTLQARGRAHLERLAHDTGETVVLGSCHGDGVMVIDRVESPEPVRLTISIGQRRPLYCTGIGKLFLARDDDATVRRWLASQPAADAAPSTDAEVATLLLDLERARVRGYSINVTAGNPHVSSYAAPVYTHGRTLIAGLAVVGPTARLDQKTDVVVETLLASARCLSMELA